VTRLVMVRLSCLVVMGSLLLLGCSGGEPPGGTDGSGGGDGSGGSDGSGGDGSGGDGSGGDGSGGTTCTPTVDCQPELLPSSGDIHQDCVDRINQFRVGCWCEPPLERWTAGEACADEQAAYDAERDQAHAGFSDGICESGWGQNECPGWGSEEQVIEGCLQMMYDEGPPPSEPCQGSCFQEHGHFINMTNTDYGRVACGFFETATGEVWSVQNFAD